MARHVDGWISRARVEALAPRRLVRISLSVAVLLGAQPLWAGPAISGVQSSAIPVDGVAAAPTPGRDGAPDHTARPPAVASPSVHHVTHWVRTSGDNGRMPYIIVDKVNATVFVFDGDGYLKGAEPALLGMATGDRTAPHVGRQALSSLRPQDRTTPAGRFVAALDKDLHGQSILWIDYDNALAMHRVAKGTPVERRAERLRSATPGDNRISYGCINVPAPFFDAVVAPTFAGTGGIVYILPEQASAQSVFGFDLKPQPPAGTP